MSNQPPQPDWLHLKRYGYAPGNYMNRCHACKAMFSDLDKRASTCRPCAEQLHARAHAAAEVLAARDCRTCAHYVGGKCWADVCADADRYEALPVVRLWRESK